MTRDERIRIHSDRAMQELDRALQAGNEKAAKAHFGLSALHLDSLRMLKAVAGEPLSSLHGH